MTIGDQDNGSVMGLDVGNRRIGVALAHYQSLLPQALKTIDNSNTTIKEIQELITANNVKEIVVGLPRSLDGNITQQTRDTIKFITQLRDVLKIPVFEQDEALTSRQAEAELISRAKPYTKSDIDALAATYILQDYLGETKVISNA
jgi:putative Holliday junction resolvase